MKKVIKLIWSNFVIGLCIFCIACSTNREKELLSRTLTQGNCVQAFEQHYQGKITRTLNQTKQLMGTTASYLLSGVGYSTDIILTFAGGVAVGAILCSPAIAIDMATKGDGSLSGECLRAMMQGMDIREPITAFGEKSYKSTRGWRCPKIDYFSEGLRHVSRCYKEQGEYDKAIMQLKFIREQPFFVECLSAVEFKNVADDLEYLLIMDNTK
ncbi:MAG: hypothetical protein HYV97_19840 [Bdellovibrio sp.]|nr:hypothetical protein [Bdellovibrio sp.]